ncbi:hypothetical protein OZX74_01650 [Bifidobacterium sp. ESL0798]|uniref:5'-nucleotidase n=1 Tax=Bifidobacterium sp. ESL0798 TaxID=2983235 RepID=UPI0023FA2390|nr:5'-nucleotidase [Bifidobacterium sp. ESL0798]WEV74288.1 hypothetical protein OZX74_01650 [Bifidobacterium sp. ESL0798]
MNQTEQQVLVVGVSSSALFDLHKEQRIFKRKGQHAYDAYQDKYVDEPLKPSRAFKFVTALLSLNKYLKKNKIEVVVFPRTVSSLLRALTRALGNTT